MGRIAPTPLMPAYAQAVAQAQAHQALTAYQQFTRQQAALAQYQNAYSQNITQMLQNAHRPPVVAELQVMTGLRVMSYAGSEPPRRQTRTSIIRRLGFGGRS